MGNRRAATSQVANNLCKKKKKTFETRHDTSFYGGVQGDALRRTRRRGAGSLQSFVRAD